MDDDEYVPPTDQEILETKADLWDDMSHELRRVANRVALLNRLIAVNAPDIVIGNQKRLVFKAIEPCRAYLNDLETLYSSFHDFME